MFEETDATMATGHITARFHGFRMKAARDFEQIDTNVRFIEWEGEDSNDYELSHVMQVPEVLQQDAPVEVVVRHEDEPYRAEDPEAPPAEVNRMLPPPVPREQNEQEGEVLVR
eukprot:g19740.t1